METHDKNIRLIMKRTQTLLATKNRLKSAVLQNERVPLFIESLTSLIHV